jgi:hypothetical protein
MTTTTHLEFDKPSLTIYGLAAQHLGIAVSPSLRFYHHAIFPFPFRDEVRWRFTHVHLSGAELSQQERLKHNGAHHAIFYFLL